MKKITIFIVIGIDLQLLYCLVETWSTERERDWERQRDSISAHSSPKLHPP